MTVRGRAMLWRGVWVRFSSSLLLQYYKQQFWLSVLIGAYTTAERKEEQNNCFKDFLINLLQ